MIDLDRIERDAREFAAAQKRAISIYSSVVARADFQDLSVETDLPADTLAIVAEHRKLVEGLRALCKTKREHAGIAENWPSTCALNILRSIEQLLGEPKP